MTEPTSNTDSSPNAGATPDPAIEPAAQATPRPSFEERVETFGRDIGAAGERIGREAEAAGQRLARDPAARRMGEGIARIWGLIVLVIGVWFLLDVTIGIDMPSIPWADIWPIGLILLGLLIVFRGMDRSRA